VTRKSLYRCSRIGLTVLIALVAALRLTARDRFAVTAPLFYAFPLIVLAVATAVLGFWWLKAGWRRSGWAFLAIALLLAAAWLRVTYLLNPADATASHPRVLLWNVSPSLTALADQISKSDADIVGLVEVYDRNNYKREFLIRKFPDYDVSNFRAGIGLMVRGRILSTSKFQLGPWGECRLFRVGLTQGPLNVLVVDFLSNPLKSRRESFQELQRLAASLDHDNLIIMGDFNTPPDSVWFDPLRSSFHSAFETAGRGLHVTWPIPLPLLPLDQIWVSRSIGVRRARLGWSFTSDHRTLTADLDLASPAP
jgi:vancomycin resistance protein VanJ